jgi:hypothetical protein
MQERIEVLCETAVHRRIMSDTIRMKNFDLENKLRVFEKKLFIEAGNREIHTKEIRQQVQEEFIAMQNLSKS